MSSQGECKLTHNLLAVRQVAPSRNWSFIKPRGCSFTLQQCSTCMLNSMETRRDGDRRPNKTVQWNLFVWCTNKAQSTEHDELHKGSIKHGFRTEPHLKEFTWQYRRLLSLPNLLNSSGENLCFTQVGDKIYSPRRHNVIASVFFWKATHFFNLQVLAVSECMNHAGVCEHIFLRARRLNNSHLWECCVQTWWTLEGTWKKSDVSVLTPHHNVSDSS